MPRAQAVIIIQRDPKDVFAFLEAGKNNLLWRPSVLDIEHISGEGFGSIWHQDVKGPGGRRIAADYEITEYAPPSRLGFRTIAGPARPSGRYELNPVDGGTELTFVLWWEPRGLARLLSAAVQKTMDAEVGQVEALKTVLEQQR